ncbi:MAG: class I SAM-dependent methyltransferase [bacterium]|nr:MAG: class I SAM-dependent methyltransferase [bacterium]
MAKLTNKCPICKSKRNTKYWAMHGYKLSRCKECEFVWDSNHQVDVLLQYDKSYFQNDNPKGGYTNYFEGMRINKRTFIDRLKKIEKKLKFKGRLLDVGAALGDCLEVATHLGWKDSYGVEVSEFAVSQAKKRGVTNIKNTVLEDSGYPRNNFDIITYQDVIEHVSNPIKELKIAYKYLKKDGLIFLVTPDIGGLWHKLLKSMWYHYKPGEHIMYFTQGSLRLALEMAGFKNIETRKTYHVLSLEYVFSRLKYYSPYFFEMMVTLSKKLGIQDYSFRAYTGEIEAWGQK